MTKKKALTATENKTASYQLIGNIVLAVSALIGVIIQVVDDPSEMNCSQVRGEVLDQAEQAPETLTLLYPKDSEEQEQCKINEYIVELDKTLNGDDDKANQNSSTAPTSP